MNNQNNTIEKTAFLQWAGAYTVAYSRNNSLIDAFPIIDTLELLHMTSLVCLEDETVIFEVALRESLARLEPFWIRDSADIINLIDPSGRAVEFFIEAIAPFQEKLNLIGNQIPVDGIYGIKTSEAVRLVNESIGEKPWLTPDGRILYQLTKP